MHRLVCRNLLKGKFHRFLQAPLHCNKFVSINHPEFSMAQPFVPIFHRLKKHMNFSHVSGITLLFMFLLVSQNIVNFHGSTMLTWNNESLHDLKPEVQQTQFSHQSTFLLIRFFYIYTVHITVHISRSNFAIEQSTADNLIIEDNLFKK